MSDLIKFIKSYKTTKLNNSDIKEITKKGYFRQFNIII